MPRTYKISSKRLKAIAAALVSGLSSSLLLFAVAACARRSQPLLVGVPQIGAEEMWEGMHAGMLQAATESGYARYWNGPTHKDDVERQIAIVEREIGRSPRGLALAPGHASKLISVVAEAQAKHIPVVLMESELAVSMGSGVSTVTSDNRRAGQVAVQYLEERLPLQAEVALIGVDPAIDSNLVRSHAFEKFTANDHRLIVVERRFNDDSVEEAELALESILDEYPKLRAVFAASLSSTRAAHTVLVRRRLSGKVLLIGCDQDRDVEELVRVGEVDAIIAQDSYQIGYRAAKELIDMDRGVPVPAHIEIAPHLFTRANIDSEEAHRILVNYTGWSSQLCTFCRAHGPS